MIYFIKYILIFISILLVIICSILSYFGFSIYELLNYTLIIDKDKKINKEIVNKMQEIIIEKNVSFFIIDSLNNIKKISGKLDFNYINNKLMIENYDFDLYKDKGKLLLVFIH